MGNDISKSFKDKFSDPIMKGLHQVVDPITNSFDKIKNGFNSVIQKIEKINPKDIANQVGDSIQKGFNDKIAKPITNEMNSFGNKIMNVVDEIEKTSKSIENQIEGKFGDITDKLTRVVGDVENVYQDIAGKVEGGVTNVIHKIEGVADTVVNEVKDGVNSAISNVENVAKDVSDKVEGGFEEAIKRAEKIGETLKDDLETVGYGIFDELKVAFGPFQKLLNVFEDIGDGFVKIGHGIEHFFEAVGEDIVGTVFDISEFVQYLAVFLFTTFMCLIRNAGNLTTCIFYYIWDAFLQLCYLPVRIVLFLLYFILPKVYDWEAQFWNYMDILDRFWYKYFQFHIIHYPKSVRDKCYNCKRLKASVFAGKVIGYSQDVFHVGEDVIEGPIAIVDGIVDIIRSFV